MLALDEPRKEILGNDRGARRVSGCSVRLNFVEFDPNDVAVGTTARKLS
jgi:hypothetical protein